MINTLPRLSFWEIAHRIHGFNPQETDPKKLPLVVQDTLRSLTREIHYDHDEKLTLLNFRGLENYGAENLKTNKQFSNNEVHEKLSDCYEGNVYDQEFLDAIYIEDEDFARWCLHHTIPLPAFWFPQGWKYPLDGEQPQKLDEEPNESKSSPAAERTSQKDRELCQAIAQTLWDIEPHMTIAAMCKHPSILKYGNGKLYTGKNTLRNWLSEVAPPEVKGKRGRPRKPESQ